MSLSKINETPVYITTLPSTGEKVKYRPFLVKEERALLTANESEDVNTMYASLEAVIRNCLLVNPSKLTTFDVEFLFVQIRSKSVGETSEVSITCEDCKADNITTINLKTVEVETPAGHSKKIKLSDSITAVMQYPTVDQLLDIQGQMDRPSAMLSVVKACIDTVYHDGDTYVIKEESDEEINGFIDTLSPGQYALLKDFVNTIPFTKIEHQWTCSSCGKQHKTILRGLFSFF